MISRMEAPPQSPTAFMPFGKYLLDEEIAKGGMARVYLARLVGLGGFEKRLVLKQILPELAQDPRFVTMFVEEAKTLVRMSHPHIVPVYELGVIDGVYFLAMEYVEGATLAELLRGGALPPAAVAHVGAQVADALSYAHQSFSLVHRDVTPRNVMVDRRGHVRLLDFGIAAHADGEGRDQAFGSVGYMSPEQAEGRAVGPESDLFSLGTVLYEALTGRAAYLRKTTEATRAALLEDAPSVRGEANVPAELAEMIDGLLQRDPAARPRASVVADRLRRWLATNHAEGAQDLWVDRVHRAEHTRRRPMSVPPPSAGTAQVTPHTQQILATSAVLQAMLTDSGTADPKLGGTVPLPRASRPSLQSAVRESRRRALWFGVAFLAAASAMFYFAKPAKHEAPRPAPPVVAVTKPKAEVPQPAAPIDAGAPAPEAAPRAAEPAYLTINAIPWADITIDNRAAGHTPKRRSAVPAGSHTLTFSCPPLGKTAKVPVTLAPNDHTQILVDLTKDPPGITVTR